MKIFNTLTGKKDNLTTISKNKVLIYSCGPTVYDFIHIGNARPLCVFDTLRRFLQVSGYEVIFCQNFTDVDDKIINRANEEGVSCTAISERYIAEYKVDAKGLNLLTPTFNPKATEEIEEMVKIIDTLVDEGYAYESAGDVYFDVSRFKEYGKLSKKMLSDLVHGARVETSDIKKNDGDFCLWKKAKENEPSWHSRYSEGRPGWHIECSAMARRYLGNTIDIHTGGADLIFPHHENEIAQSECCNHNTFSNYFMHNGYINIDGKKMSKSLKNFFTVREVSDRFGYDTIRFFMLSSHYRAPVNFSDDIMTQTKASLNRIKDSYKALSKALSSEADESNIEADSKLKDSIIKAKKAYFDALEDDLNTADAITALFDLVKACNIAIKENASKAGLKQALQIFDDMLYCLGIEIDTNEDTAKLPDDIKKLIDTRNELRANRDFEGADKVKKLIMDLGYDVKDTRDGTVITKL